MKSRLSAPGRTGWPVATAALIACAVALIYGCGRKQETAGPSAVEVVFWHTQSADNADTLKEIVARFNSANIDVNVTLQYCGGYTDLYRKMRAAISGRSTPDLAVAYESMVAEYAGSGVIVDLDRYVAHPQYGLSADEFSDIFPGYITTNRFEEFDGKLLSFPFTKSNLMLYYNLDMIRKAGFKGPPETWADFISQCRIIGRVIGNPPYALSVDPSTMDGMIYSYGGELYTSTESGKRSLFDSAETLKAFKLIEYLAANKLAFQINPGTYDDRSAFAARRVAFMIRSSTSRPYLQDMIKGKFDWGLSPIPHGIGSEPVTVMFGANICMFKSTPAKELAAWRFIRYFTSPAVTARWAVETGYLPVRKSAAAIEPLKSFLDASPRNRAAFDAIPIARPEPNIAGWQEIRTQLDAAETAVVTGLKKADEAVEELVKRANRTLSR